MSTVYDTAAKALANDLRSNPETSQLLLEYWDKLNAGKFNAFHVACFGQVFRDIFSVEEAACFLTLYADIQDGKLIVCDLPIGAIPLKDAMVSENDATLKAGLLKITRQHEVSFDSRVWCGREDDDGYLSWFPSLSFNQFTGAEWLPIEQGASCVPLEIGGQSMSKTLVQLRTIGGLARWPYGFDTIRLFLNPQLTAGGCVQSYAV